MRSESVMPRLFASAFARATSSSDMRTWICLGCRSIASAGVSFRVGFPRRLGRRFQGRGESPAKSVAEHGEACDAAVPFREGSSS